MSKLRYTALLFLGFVGFVWLVNYLSNGKAIEQEIEQEYRGVFVGDTALRQGTKALHLKIKTRDGVRIEFMPRGVREYIRISDSIVKPAKENKIFIIRNGIRKEYVYRPNWRGEGR